MRNILWRMGLVIPCLLFNLSAFAEGLNGLGNLSYTSTEQFEDDKKTAFDTFNRNLYLSLDKSITPMLSYQLNLRTSLTDSHSTDSEGITTTTYQRSAEPTIDFSLRNPIYNFGSGYRRQEQWSTAHLKDEGRKTTEVFYSRFNLTPYDLPSLSLQFEREKDYDHFPIRSIDTTSTAYFVSSAYELPPGDLKLRYNFSYRHDVDETPLTLTTRTITDNFSGTYNIGYSVSLWSERASLSAGYQGNYGRNKSQQFVSQTGNVLFKRTTLGGLYAQGTAAKPDVDVLASEVSLTDDNYTTGISSINIGTQKYHNIGIWVSSEKSVDTLYIYVNKDVSADTNLTAPGNWKVYLSNFNQAGTWTEITVLSVNVTAYDPFNNIYRYEIGFSAPQNASYFKAINMETVNAPGITDVLVTEIEAYGTEVVPETGKLLDISTSLNHVLDSSLLIKPSPRLSLSFNYSINKSDHNPDSTWESISSIFTSIFGKQQTGEDENWRSEITRSYGATSTWMTHRLLTTTLRFLRGETFDNRNETDITSNTYSLSFSSSPLPTLDTNLSLTRADRYSFGEKESLSDSILLNIGSKLYEGLKMVTDMEYIQSKSFITDTESSTHSISGSIDALFSRELSGNFKYGFSWASSDGTSSKSKNGSALITYRPGRFINLSGNISASDTDGNRTTSEGFSIDWLPLPAIRLNLNYNHSRSEPGAVITDSLSSYGTWYITKFMSAQLTYSYTQKLEEKKTEGHTLGANLSCRF